MSFAATNDAREQIRQAIDIVDLVGSYVTLDRRGKLYVGRCPWHDDSRPSLQVNQERQSWKCWVCNIGGDIFSFVMQREGVDFREALELLAQRAGIVLTRPQRGSAVQPGDPNDKQTLYEAVAWATRQFCECLAQSPEAQPARRYLQERGISDASCAAFHLGFSPDRWQWLVDRAKSTPFAPEVLEAAGLIAKSAESGRYYDFFRGRVLFSIRDAQARPIAFGGRILPGQDDPRKYVNTRETRLFSKSEHVYGLDLARDAIHRSRQAIVVEGYTDVIMAHQYGVQNVVAVLGTALGPRHIRLLRRYADTIVLVLDGDEAGQRRTNEVLELFVESDMDLRVLTLPGGLDPCDFLLQQGADVLRELLRGAVDALEHAIRVRTQGIDLLRDTHRANLALEQVLGILAKAPRISSADTAAKLVRERQMLARLSREFRLEDSLLRTRLGELRRAVPARRVDTPASPPVVPVTAGDLDPFDAELLEILIRHPELAEIAIHQLRREQLRNRAATAVWDVYVRLQERGTAAEFGRVLAELEDMQLKSLLVELDERAQSKEQCASEDAATRLARLVQDLQYRHQQALRKEQVAALEQRCFNDQEEVAVFQQLIEQERRRQGLAAPTDG